MQRALIAALALATACGERPPAMPAGVTLASGAVNGVRIEAGDRRIAVYGDPLESGFEADFVLLTHHRRDVVWAARGLAERGAAVVAPAAERALFEEVDGHWSDYRTGRFHDYAQQSSKVLTDRLEIDRAVRGGDRLALLDGAVEIEVVDTPGYTRGAVSYLMERDGVRIAFVGDLIYGDGRILDLFSLQDAIPEADVRGYHGYAARAADLIRSLRAIAAREPDLLIPARGPVVDNPQEAIGKLIARLQALFREYYRTDALRWYWGDDNLRLRAARVLSDAKLDWMPSADELREIPPRWMHKFNTSRLIVSDSGAAFLIDCGTDEVMRQIDALRERGVFNRLEGIFVTHYHDDHTDRVQAMAEACRCPVYAGARVADILERPAAYRMPAQTDQAIADVQVLEEGQTLRWREYALTYAYFPGQAIYHGSLKLERDDGEKFFFIGDAFSPTGLDDYCILNRHFFHPDLGHLLCLRKIREAGPQFWLVNQHIEPTFRYGAEQLDLMERSLNEKRRVIAELTPWEDPNYGMDEQWARLYPYGVEAVAGEPLEMWAVVFNHSAQAREFRVRPRPPVGWESSGEVVLRVEPLREGRTAFTLTPPADAAGLSVVPADVAFGDWDLREWIEAMIEVRPRR